MKIYDYKRFDSFRWCSSGTLDKFAVFMVRNGTQVAGRYKKPIDKKTASQLASRAQFGSLSGTWRDELLESERAKLEKLYCKI